MKWILSLAVLSAGLAAEANAGGAASKREFDAAVIRLNRSGNARGDTDVEDAIYPGGRLMMRNVPLKALIAYAYSHANYFPDTYVAGAPGWAGSERFDITAKAPAGSTDSAIAPMLQSFLEQQFKLETHQEQRRIDAFQLVVGKHGPKLRRSSGSGDADCEWNELPASDYGGIHRICTHMTMADFADWLPWLGRGYVDRPVIDRTGLTGSYDFRLDWVSPRRINDGGLTIFDALTKIGLRLEESKVPVMITVVDHIEKLAEDN